MPPLAFPLAAFLVGGVAAVLRYRPIRNRLWKPHYWLFLTQELYFFASIVVAVLSAAPAQPGFGREKPIGEIFLDVLLWSSLISGSFWIWRMRGLRWLALCLMAIAEVQDLGDAFPGIESRPDVCGGEACVFRTRIPVRLLETARRNGVTEQVLLSAYPALRAEDLVNSWN